MQPTQTSTETSTERWELGPASSGAAAAGDSAARGRSGLPVAKAAEVRHSAPDR
jgi:hypothetical protein